jgi:hypothetical protein
MAKQSPQHETMVEFFGKRLCQLYPNHVCYLEGQECNALCAIYLPVVLRGS